MTRLAAVLILTASLSSQASARIMTCGQLRDILDNKVIDTSFDPGAELLGVAATHRELCIPQGMTLGVLRAVFIHWADNNPKLANMPSWDCAARAFADSFPCAKN